MKKLYPCIAIHILFLLLPAWAYCAPFGIRPQTPPLEPPQIRTQTPPRTPVSIAALPNSPPPLVRERRTYERPGLQRQFAFYRRFQAIDSPTGYDPDSDSESELPRPPQIIRHVLPLSSPSANADLLPPIHSNTLALPFPVNKDSQLLQKIEERKTTVENLIPSANFYANGFYPNKDFRSAKAILNLTNKREIEKTQKEAIERYHVNYDQISNDPYLARHSVDIHQLYPQPISDLDWSELKTTLSSAIRGAFDSEAGSAELLLNLNDVFEKIELYSSTRDQKGTEKKRLYRLYQNAKTKAGEHVTDVDVTHVRVTRSTTKRQRLHSENHLNHPYTVLAISLSENERRCIDGIRDKLSSIENVDLSMQLTEDAGDFISRALTEYKIEFIDKHAQLNPLSSEFQTTVREVLRQRMLFSLGLRGSRQNIAYPYLADPSKRALHPDQVMTRFLTGGSVSIYRNQTSNEPFEVEFEAYTVEHMVKVLQETRLRALRRSSSVGTKLTNTDIERFSNSDSLLKSHYEKFMGDIVEGNTPEEDLFFELSNDQFVVKDAFWLYLLEKYGYIVRP